MVAERSVKVAIKGDVSDFNRAMLEASAGARALAGDLAGADDRMKRLIETGLALGPALVPIASAAIPAVVGLSNELGIAAAGAGVAALAFSGIGTALKAVNDYAIAPTDAHLKKLNDSMDAVGPAGANFVNFLQSARPELQKLQGLAGAGLFPGIEEGLTNLVDLGPQVERIIKSISFTLGELSSKAGANLAGPEFKDFFDFLERTARPTLIRLGETFGNFVQGFASLWVAFEPVSNDFSKSFLNMSEDFTKWAAGLSETQGFQDFLAYIERVTPKVGETLGALSQALLDILKAAEPVGEVSLPIITALSRAFSAIANTPIGPALIGAAAGLAAFSRAANLLDSVNGSQLGKLLGGSFYGGTLTATKALPGSLLAVESAATRANTKVGMVAESSTLLGKNAAGAARLIGGGAGLAFVLSGLDDKLGVTNAATFALAGSLLGPYGAALGGAIGLAKDFANSNDDIFKSLDRLQAGLDSNSGSLTDQINAIAEARAKVAKFKDDVSEKNFKNGDQFSLKKDFSVGKNLVEGLFGKSDVEEAQDALDKATATYKENERAAQDLAFSEAGLAGQMLGASDAARQEAASLLESLDAKNKAVDAANNAFSAETNYRQALKDAYEQAATNNAGIEGNSKAAIKNRQTISSLTGAWSKLAASGTETDKSLRAARNNFVAVAVAMGVPIDVARALSRELLNIPTNVKPTVTVTDDASDVIKTIIRNLGQLHDKTIVIRTNTETGKSELHGGGRTALTPASGGYISGPGGPRDDVIPAMLSNGEFVVNAAATKRNRALLHSINAQQFAAGGYVGSSTELDRLNNLAQIADLEAELAKRYKTGKKKGQLEVTGLDRITKALELANLKIAPALDKFTTKATALGEKVAQFSTDVANNFKNNPFNKGGDNGYGGYTSNFDAFQLQIATDTSNARLFDAALKAAEKKGLNGPLLGALAASGDISTAQGFASSSKGEIAKLEKQYAARASAAATLGTNAAQATYGKQIASLTAELVQLRRHTELGTKTIEQLAKQIGGSVGASLATAAKGAQNKASNSVKGR